MINILQNYLKKLKVNEFSQLSEEEKETYRQWETILEGRKLTDDDVSRFLDKELDEVLTKLQNPNLNQREDVFLKMKLEFIRKIKIFLNVPEMEKKLLEDKLNTI